MANRAKRLEREMTLLKEQEAFKMRFKKEKKLRRDGIHPTLDLLVNAKSKKDFFNRPSSLSCEAIFVLKEKLKYVHPKAYYTLLQMLQYSKSLFSSMLYYKWMVELFFELQIHRGIDTWKAPRTKDDDIVFKSLFIHLFVKYRIPNCIEREIVQFTYWNNSFDQTNVKLMLHIVQGKGVHQFPHLKIQLNSKMNFFFLNSPPQLTLAEAIWWAKIRSKGIAYSLALKLVKYFNVGIDFTWEDWNDELIFFLNRFKDIGKKELNKIVEFFACQKRDHFHVRVPNVTGSVLVPALYPDLQLKGRTVASVLRFVHEWECYVRLIKDNGGNSSFPTSKIRPFRTHFEKKLITVKQIKSVRDLAKEGKAMGHCVGTYTGYCVSGKSSIWTMKLHLDSGKIQKALTIEILEKEKTINEALGKSNRAATTLEKKWLTAWAKREGLKCEW